jgi:MFS family permease/G:T/U-mismatch repair DNA glycosylase
VNWRYRHTALALCTLAFTATMVARLAISPLVPQITTRFGVTNATVGLALSGMWLAYALAQFPSGVLGDRYGERAVILTAVAAPSVASLPIAASPSIAVFMLFTVVLGAGAGLHYSVATTFLAKQFDDIGRAIGVHVAGGPIAGLAAPPVAALVGSRYGWRAGVLLGVAVAVPVFALFAWRVRPTEPVRPDQAMRERFELASLAELLSRPPILYTTALATMSAFTWQATASFLPTFLEVGTGLSTALSALLFSAYFLVHGGTQPVTGSVSDRIGRDATAMVTMAETTDTLPDYLAEDLDLIVIGQNPSPASIRRQCYYGNPRNRFWPAFRAAGLAPPDFVPEPAGFRRLLERERIGFTDVVKRPTASASELRAADFREWAPVLDGHLRRYRPRIAWFNGKGVFESYLRYGRGLKPETIELGRQSATIEDAIVFVTPNPSPANAAFSLEELIGWYLSAGGGVERAVAGRWWG